MVKNQKTAVFGILLALLFFSGCVTVDYNIEQEFREDGTSHIEIDEYLGLSRGTMDAIGDTSLIDPTDSSGIAAVLLLEFYSSREYPDTLCSLMEGVDCHGDDEGRLHVEAEFEPGEYYEFEKETDWLNLKEKSTYSIEKVPLGQYFSYKGRGEEAVADALLSAAVDYGKKNVDKYLTEDYYCTTDMYLPSVECGISSISGGAAAVKLTGGSYDAVRVTEVSCSGEDEDEFMFLYKAQDAKAVVEELNPVGEILQEGESIFVNVDCPTTANTIVVFYETRSYYTDNVTEDFVVFDIKTKEELKQKIEDELQDSLDGYDMGYTGGAAPSYMDETTLLLDFEKGEVMGMEFDELSDAASTGSVFQMEINVDYVAKFPNRVTSAEVDGEEVRVTGNQIELGLEELEDLPEGRLVVTTEKELSPLGMFTWVVGVLVLAVLAYLAFMRR